MHNTRDYWVGSIHIQVFSREAPRYASRLTVATTLMTPLLTNPFWLRFQNSDFLTMITFPTTINTWQRYCDSKPDQSQVLCFKDSRLHTPDAMHKILSPTRSMRCSDCRSPGGTYVHDFIIVTHHRFPHFQRSSPIESIWSPPLFDVFFSAWSLHSRQLFYQFSMPDFFSTSNFYNH